MRRTYRSKKDAGGALDHKDVLLTMDEKSSAFDAFYIQNIKQTKREMSSVNFLAAPPSKVRKRKYVKRIIKEPEPQKDSTLDSVYLTPNKSLHVNKPLDPFDQLLNSSSNQQNDSLKVNKGGTFGYQNVAKTYRRRKVTKVKKYNYSSSDTTDSDKENSDNSKTPDKSNIKKHELLIEKDSNNSLTCLDKSIKDLVQNFSILKKTSPKTPGKLTTPFKFVKNRLTTNIRSPILQNSPLCSTPFKEKYRGASIYNFSPISSKVFNETLDESQNKSNDSIIFAGKEKHYLSKEQEMEAFKSPVFKTPDNYKPPSTSVDCKKNLSIHNSKSVGEVDPQISLENQTIPYVQDTDKLQEHTTSYKECDKPDNKVMSSIEISSLQTTEIEAFLGFSNNESVLKDNNDCAISHEGDVDVTDEDRSSDENIDNITRVSSKILECKNNSDASQYNHSLENSVMLFSNDNPIENEINEECATVNTQHDKSIDNSVRLTESFENANIQITDVTDEDRSSDENIDNITRVSSKILECKNNSDASQYNHSLENSVMLFSNDNPIENEINEECATGNTQHDKSIDNSVRLTESFENANIQINKQYEEDNVSHHCSNTSLDSKNGSIMDHQSFEKDVTVEIDDVGESSSDSQDSDNQSLYDTCDSGDISQDDSKICFSKLPVVELQRLNDSVFEKYYCKMSEHDEIENSESCPDSEDYESVDNISEISDKSIENTSYSENIKDNSNLVISDDNDTDTNSNTDEDRCISFVTTRRRNEVANDSMILDFNDSYGSVSSIECDKTVLSNNRSSITKSDNEATLVDDMADSLNIVESNILTAEDVTSEKAELNVFGRKTIRQSILPVNNEDGDCHIDFKPSIVLQPGKKWERSLSIYKRLTMANDHLDHSFLEDEQMQSKGRKYRQSIISTMEMQDSIQHNESLYSRRSTFVSKPCRSTIRIVKELNTSRTSLCTTTLDDLKGFLNEDCDDTIIELSKLSIADSEHEVTVIETFHDSAGRVATARDYVLRRCNQTDVVLFDECYPETVLKNCHKIGEGVYGEVFLWRARDGRARVMKIVPIAGSTKVNGESQKDFHEIISEIVIAMELSALRAPIPEIERHIDDGNDIDALDLHAVENATDVFNEVLAVKCVYGSYPSRLLDLWDLYDECKGSENDNPAILPIDQQYLVLELANAGQDLESYQFNSAEQAHALFLQVAFALAVGEESFQFEHRDLHWGNVLIAPTDKKFATFVLRGRAHLVPRCGVAATIIDYSLSRLSLPLGTDRAALYNDLAADEGLFDARGDYQFDVYRLMREKLGNDWKNFEPYTNILWLHYTVDKMITALRYKRTNTKIHKHYIAKLKGIKNRILDYGSAVQFVLTDNEY